VASAENKNIRISQLTPLHFCPFLFLCPAEASASELGNQQWFTRSDLFGYHFEPNLSFRLVHDTVSSVVGGSWRS